MTTPAEANAHRDGRDGRPSASGSLPSKRGHATIRDVAALAGVSVKSVSRVVNGESGVRPAMVDKITAAIDQLGYRHNLAASNLRRTGQRTMSVGVVIQDVANPFAAALLRAVEEVARTRGVVVLASSIDGDVERERQVIDELLRRRVDGIVLMPTTLDHSAFAGDRNRGVPFVFVDRAPAGLDADYVGADNTGGVRRAVAALARRGHRRIAFVGDTHSIPTAIERLEGYHQAMTDAGLPIESDLVVQDVSSPQQAEEMVTGLLASAMPPTALLTAQNLITTGALRAMTRLGVRREVAHVGFDDVELGELLDPGVSVVRQSPTAIGRTAAELIFARLDGDDGPPRRVVTPVETVERGSGELAPVRSSV